MLVRRQSSIVLKNGHINDTVQLCLVDYSASAVSKEQSSCSDEDSAVIDVQLCQVIFCLRLMGRKPQSCLGHP